MQTEPNLRSKVSQKSMRKRSDTKKTAKKEQSINKISGVVESNSQSRPLS